MSNQHICGGQIGVPQALGSSFVMQPTEFVNVNGSSSSRPVGTEAQGTKAELTLCPLLLL